MNDGDNSSEPVRLELAGWFMCLSGCLVLILTLCDYQIPMNDTATVIANMILCLFCLMAGAFLGANWDKFFGGD